MDQKNVLSVALLAAAIPFASIAQYQNESETLEKVYVIEATAIDEGRIEPSRRTSVITGEEIRKKNPQTVADALKNIPGIEVLSQGSVGQTTSLFIRGARAPDTLVLIDGVEINDIMAPSGAFDFANLSAANIERIEIYHGPQSVRFGAGALGGVVNIITKSGSGSPVFSYDLIGGSYNTLKAGLGARGQLKNFGYALSVEALHTDGFSAARAKNGDDDGADTFSGATKFTYQPDSKSQIELTTRHTQVDFEMDNDGGLNGDDPNYTSLSEQAVVGLKGTRRFLEDRLKSDLGVYYSNMERKISNKIDPINNFELSGRFFSENVKAQSDHALVIGENHEVRLSLQWREESGHSFSDFGGGFTSKVDKKSEDIWGGALTYLFENDRTFFDIGYRYDESSVAGSIPSYRGSLGMFLDDKKLKSYITVGTGFKTPTLYQLYSAFGDPKLKEEHGKTYQFTVEHTPNEKSQYAVTVFENQYEDLIDFSGSKYFNVAKARSRGIEVESGYQVLSTLKLLGRYAYLDAVDRTTNKTLYRQPKNAWALTAEYAREKWLGFVEYRFKGKRPDLNPTTLNRNTNKAYDVVNIGGSYEWSKVLKFNVRIENLFDRTYDEVLGYSTPGLSVYGGISGEI